MPMRWVVLALLWIVSAPGHTSAQVTEQTPTKPPGASTLVILARAEDASDLGAFGPTFDAVCQEFELHRGRYRNVVRLHTETDLSPLLSKVTPHDDSSQVGDFLRRVITRYGDQTLQNCSGGEVAGTLKLPVEALLFTVNYSKATPWSVTVEHDMFDTTVQRIEQPQHAHVNMSLDAEVLGRCASQVWWMRDGLDRTECRSLGFDVPAEPTSLWSELPSKWWFWGALGVIAAGSVTAIAVAASGGGSHDVFPSCPSGFTCR